MEGTIIGCAAFAQTQPLCHIHCVNMCTVQSMNCEFVCETYIALMYAWCMWYHTTHIISNVHIMCGHIYNLFSAVQIHVANLHNMSYDLIWLISGADRWQKLANMFTSGRKHQNLCMGVLRYADFKKIGNHNIGPMVPAQNWGSMGGGGGFYLFCHLIKIIGYIYLQF